MRRELNSALSSQLDGESKVKLLNETDDENRTPLYYAVEKGALEMASELMEHGAKPSLDDVLVASKRNSGTDFLLQSIICVYSGKVMAKTKFCIQVGQAVFVEISYQVL